MRDAPEEEKRSLKAQCSVLLTKCIAMKLNLGPCLFQAFSIKCAAVGSVNLGSLTVRSPDPKLSIE